MKQRENMKTVKFSLLVISILVFCAFAPQVLEAQEIIDVNLVDQFHYDYPSEITGLTYDGTYLWMYETYCDSIIALDLNSGAKMLGFPSPIEPAISGLAYDGENIWASAELFLYQISYEDGSLITSFHVPHPCGTGAIITDLEWHDGYLHCLIFAGFSSTIAVVDVDLIETIDTVMQPGSAVNGLTFMDGYFWVHDAQYSRVIKANSGGWPYNYFFHYHYCGYIIGMTTDEEYMYCSDSFCNIYKYEIIDE